VHAAVNRHLPFQPVGLVFVTAIRLAFSRLSGPLSSLGSYQCATVYDVMVYDGDQDYTDNVTSKLIR